MKTKMFITITLALFVVASGINGYAQGRLTLNAGAFFNINVKYSEVPGYNLAAPDIWDDSSLRTYDDGFVQWDGTDRGAKVTGYWGFDNINQVAGDQVSMHKILDWPAAPSSSESPIGPGLEVVYQYDLGKIGKKSIWGIEAGVGVAWFCSDTSQQSRQAGKSITDTYSSFCPWADDWKNLQAPYSGAVGQDPLLMIDLLPPIRTTGMATVESMSNDSLDASLITLRVGPFVSIPLSERLDLDLSAGLAGARVSTDYAWSVQQTSGNSSRRLSGENSESEFLLGGYVAAQASYYLGKDWIVGVGAQYTYLGEMENQAGPKVAQFDPTGSIRVFLGIGKNF